MAGEKKEGAMISLKLLTDARNKKVLFAEAGKDFVDFMFSLLTLPVASVIKLLSHRAMVGCIGKLHHSVEKLNDTYLLRSTDKGSLLQPWIPNSGAVSPLLLGSGEAGSAAEVKYYRCSKCNANVTTAMNVLCPTCRTAMTAKMAFVVPTAAPSSDGGEGGGYVKGVVTYMVTDDLDVTPMSAISSITLVNKYCVKKDGCQLEEKVVSFGMEEGIALLEASLRSNTALTNVFLGKSLQNL